MTMQNHSPELEARVKEHLQTWHNTLQITNPEAIRDTEGYESLELLRRRLGVRLELRLGGGKNEIKVVFLDQSGKFPIDDNAWPNTIGGYVLHL